MLKADLKNYVDIFANELNIFLEQIALSDQKQSCRKFQD